MILTTTVMPGETLFDVAVRDYGHIQGVFELARHNGCSMTDTIAAGSILDVDSSVSYSRLKGISLALVTEDAPNEVLVNPYQNSFDLALQLYGDLSGVLQLAKDNRRELTAEFLAGEVIRSRNFAVNKLVVDYYKGRKIMPATGLTVEEDNELKPTGVDYWGIEVDFIVN